MPPYNCFVKTKSYILKIFTDEMMFWIAFKIIQVWGEGQAGGVIDLESFT